MMVLTFDVRQPLYILLCVCDICKCSRILWVWWRDDIRDVCRGNECCHGRGRTELKSISADRRSSAAAPSRLGKRSYAGKWKSLRMWLLPILKKLITYNKNAVCPNNKRVILFGTPGCTQVPTHPLTLYSDS